MIPGEYFIANEYIVLNQGREEAAVTVANTGDRPVQVGSHFHFFEVNKCLSFDRKKALGRRLDIPSGTAVRFEPGEEKEVNLVSMAGEQEVYGLNDLTAGSLKNEETLQNAVIKAKEGGFKGVDNE